MSLNKKNIFIKEKNIDWKWTKQNFKNFIVNNLKISIKDIALMGILMALYLIVAAIVNFTLLGATRVSFEYIFYMIFGIIFGPIKGVFLSILSDTFSLLLTGRIATWMIHYAMIPPLISLISYLFLLFYYSKKNIVFIFPIILSALVLVVVFTVFTIGWLNNNLKIADVKGQATLYSIIAISLISLFVLSTNIFCFYKYFKTKKLIYRKIIFMMALVIFIMVLARWLWGPIAFIAYYNQFIANGRPSYTLKDNFEAIALPIILKSALVVPLFTIILIPLTNTIKLLQEKYFQKYQYSKSIY